MDIDQIRQFTPQLLLIAQKYGISNIYVFGSIVRGDNILDKSPKPGRIEPMQPELLDLRSRHTLSHPRLRKAGLLA